MKLPRRPIRPLLAPALGALAGAVLTYALAPRGQARPAASRAHEAAVAPVQLGEIVLVQREDPARETPDDPVWREFWVPVEQPARDHSEVASTVLAWAALRPGMSVADVGAGGGYFAVRFARTVGPLGLVWATDVDARMVRKLAWERTRAGLFNLVPQRVALDSMGLPPSTFDLVTMVHVGLFSTCAREPIPRFAEQIARSVKPGGRWIIADGEASPTARRTADGACGAVPPDEVAAVAAPWFARERVHPVALSDGWRGYVMMLRRR